MNRSNRYPQLVALFVTVLAMTSCMVYPKSYMDKTKISTDLTGQTIQWIDSDGNLQSTNPGVAGTLLNQDAHGQWTAQGLPVGALSVNPTTGALTIASPKDVRLVNVKITPAPEPGQPFFQADAVEANVSAPLAVAAGALVGHLQAMQGMNQDAALAYVEGLKVLAPELKSALVSIVEMFIAP